jgi:hypothetical protein
MYKWANVNPLVKEAARWISIGGDRIRPIGLASKWPRAPHHGPPSFSPAVARYIIRRFFQHVAQDPDEAVGRPIREVFLPLRDRLAQMFPGSRLPTSQWTREKQIEGFIRRMKRMPTEDFPFMVGSLYPDRFPLRELLKSKYFWRVPILFHGNLAVPDLPSDFWKSVKNPNVLGEVFSSYSVWPGVKLPPLAAMVKNPDSFSLPMDTIVHEALHAVHPYSAPIPELLLNPPRGFGLIRAPNELALGTLIPYIAKKETEYLARTGEVTPMAALRHAYNWKRSVPGQLGYIKRVDFMPAVWNSAEGKAALRWIKRNLRNAFRGNELVHRIGQAVMDPKNKRQVNALARAIDQYTADPELLLVWDLVHKRGIPFREIDSAKILQAAQDLPETSPIYKAMMYGPRAAGDDYWDLALEAQKTLSALERSPPGRPRRRIIAGAKEIDKAILDLIK